KAGREETILATLLANGYPSLEGKWYYIGPFDNADKKGFAFEYPPEKEINLTKSYEGKAKVQAGWKELPNIHLVQAYNLKLSKDKNNEWACVYLYHEFEWSQAVFLPLSLGSDDTLTVWFNRQRLLADEAYRGCQPDQNSTTLDVQPGKNQLLLKVCQ